jgi:hypothetical protein
MSIPELRTRIVELNTEIELHRQTQRKLERDRILVQRQINALTNPWLASRSKFHPRFSSILWSSLSLHDIVTSSQIILSEFGQTRPYTKAESIRVIGILLACEGWGTGCPKNFVIVGTQAGNGETRSQRLVSTLLLCCQIEISCNKFHSG